MTKFTQEVHNLQSPTVEHTPKSPTGTANHPCLVSAKPCQKNNTRPSAHSIRLASEKNKPLKITTFKNFTLKNYFESEVQAAGEGCQQKAIP